jgi:hypothetical protein
MTSPVLDPQAALLHARLDDLTREAAAERSARVARAARARTARPWPAFLVAALRRSIGVTSPASARTPRGDAACATC